MAALAIASWRAAVLGRWTARIFGTLVVLLILNPQSLTATEKLQFLGLSGMVAGLLIAWKWEGAGGLLTAAAFAFLAAIGRGHLGWALVLPAAIAVVHVACWARLHSAAPAGLAPWNVPRALVGLPVAFIVVFLLLCAGEIFPHPPLMAPALAPSAELAGVWHSDGVELVIHGNASVTGSVHGSAISEGRITNGRSWFGKLMHFNAQYLVTGRAVGKPFTIPLLQRSNVLDGALFVDGRPAQVTLRK